MQHKELKTQAERDAAASLLRELRRMSPHARNHFLKYEIAKNEQARKVEHKRKLRIV